MPGVRIESRKVKSGPEGGWYWNWRIVHADTGETLDWDGGSHGARWRAIEAAGRVAASRGWTIIGQPANTRRIP